MVTIEFGQNLKDVALAFIALGGTVSGYYFGYRRAQVNSVNNPPAAPAAAAEKNTNEEPK